MRGRLFLTGLLIAGSILMTGCVQRITDPADELMMYSWRGTAENGSEASLGFDEDQAQFIVSNKDYTLDLTGFCILTDDRMVLCDRASGHNYVFGYRLYGDRVELSYDERVITLKKNVE